MSSSSESSSQSESPPPPPPPPQPQPSTSSSNSSNNSHDPRRPDRIRRFKSSYSLPIADDQLQEYMNIIGMIFSMCGLMMKIKWCAWLSVLCSFIGFANSRSGDDNKQILSCFMLSISAVVMSYIQNPTPMNLPFT